jgi:hypothetical protein
VAIHTGLKRCNWIQKRQIEVNIMTTNELFVELSDEQQEIVAGGAIYSGGLNTYSSSFLNTVGFGGGSMASPLMASSGVNLVATNAATHTGTYYGGFQITP